MHGWFHKQAERQRAPTSTLASVLPSFLLLPFHRHVSGIRFTAEAFYTPGCKNSKQAQTRVPCHHEASGFSYGSTRIELEREQPVPFIHWCQTRTRLSVTIPHRVRVPGSDCRRWLGQPMLLPRLNDPCTLGVGFS